MRLAVDLVDLIFSQVTWRGAAQRMPQSYSLKSYLRYPDQIAKSMCSANTEFRKAQYSPIPYGNAFSCMSDASFPDDRDTRHRSESYVFMLFGGAIDWRASKQKTVTTSSTEAEILALSNAASETILWERLFFAISLDVEEDSALYSDNLQTIRLLTAHGRKLNSPTAP